MVVLSSRTFRATKDRGIKMGFDEIEVERNLLFWRRRLKLFLFYCRLFFNSQLPSRLKQFYR